MYIEKLQNILILFQVLDELINNTILAEKLAESINKVKKPKDKRGSESGIKVQGHEESSKELKESDFHTDLHTSVGEVDLDSFLAQVSS